MRNDDTMFTQAEDEQMVNMKYIEGKTFREIADAMGYTQNQIKARIGNLISKDDRAKELHLANLESRRKYREFRDKKIGELIDRGYSTREEAEQMQVAKQTVRNVKKSREVTRWNQSNNGLQENYNQGASIKLDE